MKCIYLLFNGLCGAHPQNIVSDFRPDPQTRKDFCENDSKMRTCPRLQQYLDYLKASQTKKTTKKRK